jgi:N6-adenosine-specific RNA methylase IME4
MSDWFFAPLERYSYQFIMIDPPLAFQTRTPAGEEKSAQAQYDCMTDAEVMALPVWHLADRHCLLWLWATAPKLPLALDCVKAWGFEYKSLMLWRKMTVNGKVRMGTGFRVRSTGELVIVATKGRPQQAYVPPTIFDGVAREHSRKPDEAYLLAEKVMPDARRADIFSRQQRPNWETWGDETGKYEALG